MLNQVLLDIWTSCGDIKGNCSPHATINQIDCGRYPKSSNHGDVMSTVPNYGEIQVSITLFYAYRDDS